MLCVCSCHLKTHSIFNLRNYLMCKKIKPDITSEEVREFNKLFRLEESSLHTSDCLVDPTTTTPHELSKVKHIIKQFSLVAETKGLKVYTNTSDFGNKQYFSKYNLSRPDVATFLPSEFLIGNEVKSKWLVLNSADENSDENSEDILCGTLENICLNGEAKGDRAKSKDPVGQLLAGLDKTLADLVSTALKDKNLLISRCTLYGLYFIPDTDTCQVYKLNVVMGKETVAFRGKEDLSISDAFNRVLREMTKVD